jgi:hypothetical protein
MHVRRIVYVTNCLCDEMSCNELSCNELSMRQIVLQRIVHATNCPRRIVRDELSATNGPSANISFIYRKFNLWTDFPHIAHSLSSSFLGTLFTFTISIHPLHRHKSYWTRNSESDYHFTST